MPGPKMGPRPTDFDEEIIRQSPTFARWMQLKPGQKLRYACREFEKGRGDDEERLMRRVMIARRNNIRDHETLKKARKQVVAPVKPVPENKRKRTITLSTEQEILDEMDGPAVEATRSYKTWLALADGDEFVYNQKYIKGREGHDWLLRKNIWRRMRYRRENKKIIDRLRHDRPTPDPMRSTDTVSLLIGQSLLADAKNKLETSEHHATQEAAAAAAATSDLTADQDAVEAAVAAAESFGRDFGSAAQAVVQNHLDSSPAESALDAAAKLAAVTGYECHKVLATKVVDV